MKGYVKNIGKAPIYIFKGVVNPNDTITFDYLLKRFGDVADVKSEEAFAKWLSKNKFLDKSRWSIVVDKKSDKNINKNKVKNKETPDLISDKVVENKDNNIESKEEIKPKLTDKEEDIKTVSNVTTTNKEIITKSVTGVKKDITVDYIVDLKVTDIKRCIDKIEDLRILKVALKKAEGMSKKATLCNALRDRITVLSVR